MKTEFSTIFRDNKSFSTYREEKKIKTSPEELLKKCLLLE